MGCSHSQKELISQSYQELEEVNKIQQHKSIIIPLARGGFVIQTKIGNIQYGTPPESVKDSILGGVAVSEYYIIPQERFDFEDGISLVEIEFPVYYNFFLKKRKTTLICNQDVKKKIETIFRETLLGPKDFSDFQDDFVQGYSAIPNIQKELEYFAVNPFDKKQKLSIEMFIEFKIYDNKGEVILYRTDKENLQHDIKVKIQEKKNCYIIYENNQFLTKFSKEIKVKKKKYPIYSSMGNTLNFNFEAPDFGITALGCSHGFDANDSTSGFIVWINKKGIMIDPPPYTSHALRNEGIPPNLIEKIVLTHCHADHDAGTFHKLVESQPIEFLTTKTIMKSFIRKYSAQCDISTEELQNLFQYREIKIGHEYCLFGGKFIFNYSLHSIPCLSIIVKFQGKQLYLSGDTFYHPEQLQKMLEQGTLTLSRYKQLAEIDFNKFDLIIHEAGVPPIHTPIDVLGNLSPQIKEKLFLYHVAVTDIPFEKNLQRLKPGLDNTKILYQNYNDQNAIQSVLENLDLLSTLDIIKWIPFRRITEVINCFHEKRWKEDQMLISQGSFGNDFFIVKSGVIRIYNDCKDNKFDKLIFRGDYFGESAICGQNRRMANVKAITDCVCLVIDSQDFKWIFDFQKKSPINDSSPLDLILNLQQIRKEKLAEFINNNKSIEKMTESEKCMINMLIEKKELKEQQILWKKGVKTDFCFIVKSGQYEMIAPAEKVPKLFQIRPGCLIGDFPNLLQNVKTQSQVTCTEPGTILVLSRQKLLNFLKQYPAFYLQIKNNYIVY